MQLFIKSTKIYWEPAMNIKLKLAELSVFCKILELLLATSSLHWLSKKRHFLFYLPNQRHAFLILGLGYSKFSSPYLLLTVDGYTPLHMGSKVVASLFPFACDHHHLSNFPNVLFLCWLGSILTCFVTTTPPSGSLWGFLSLTSSLITNFLFKIRPCYSHTHRHAFTMYM